MILDNAIIVNYDRNHTFIVLATINMMVNYDCKTFIVQATALFQPPACIVSFPTACKLSQTNSSFKTPVILLNSLG